MDQISDINVSSQEINNSQQSGVGIQFTPPDSFEQTLLLYNQINNVQQPNNSVLPNTLNQIINQSEDFIQTSETSEITNIITANGDNFVKDDFKNFLDCVINEKLDESIYSGNIWSYFEIYHSLLLGYKYGAKEVNDETQYKSKYKFNFYQCFLRNEEFIDGFYNIVNNLKLTILKEIVGIDKSHILISKIDFERVFHSLTLEHKVELYFETGLKSNIVTFEFISKISYIVSINRHIQYNRSIISAVCRNSDIRLLKYVVNNFDDFKSDQIIEKSSISQILKSCFSMHIPDKYILRRLKLLYQVIDLSKYFCLILENCNSIDLVPLIFKFYYKEEVIDKLSLYRIYYLIRSNINDNDKSIINITIRRIYDCMGNSIYNKLQFLMIIFVKDFRIMNYEDKNNGYQLIDKINEEILEDYQKEIIESLISNSVRLSEIGRDFISHPCYENILFILNKINKNTFTRFFNNIFGKSGSYFKIKKICKYKNLLFFCIPWLDYFYPKRIVIDYANCNTKFLFYDVSKEFKDIIHFNKLLHSLKVFRRKIYNLCLLKRTVKNIKINKEYNIQNSVYYPCDSYIKTRNEFDKQWIFSKTPPRNILSYELEILHNEFKNSTFIVREKADGYLTNKLPYKVYPDNFNILDNTEIRAEFIDELDLFLIFDFNFSDLPTEESFMENDPKNVYNYLRSLHPDTKDYQLGSKIYDINTLKLEIIKERERFNKFLEKPYENYRVYPKACWLISLSCEKMCSDLENLIFFETDSYSNDFLRSEKILYDGLIISPINPGRDLKLKPLNQLTIDLFCKFCPKNKKYSFTDRDNICWDELISIDDSYYDNKVLDDTIVRLKPKIHFYNLEFIVDSIRFDKSNSNPNKIVCQIISTIMDQVNFMKKTDKKFNVSERNLNLEKIKSDYYYSIHNKKCIYPNYWKKIIDDNKIIFKNFINIVNPLKDKNWLDLGCGGCRHNFPYIYNLNNIKMKGYIGVDFCIDILIKGIKRLDNYSFLKNGRLTNENNIRFVKADLRDNWVDNTSLDFINDKNIIIKNGIDYIISVFALPHFFCDNFWSNLGKIVKIGTKFIFNIIQSQVNSWEKDENYLKIDTENKVVKYKFYNQSSGGNEKLITDNDLEEVFQKYGWKEILNNKNDKEGNNLSSFYTWYCIEKVN